MHRVAITKPSASRRGSSAASPRGRGWMQAGITMALLLAPATGRAGDLPPQLMARFTRQVQPLILNKCAAGACHGGPSAHSPAFNRGDVRGQ